MTPLAVITLRRERRIRQPRLNTARITLGDEAFLGLFAFEWKPKTKKELDGFLQHAPKDKSQPVPPAWTLALTFSADMQIDHFYWSVAAHGLSPERTHVIDYGRVARFDDLEQIIFHSRYVSAYGRELGIWRAALDTGGTQHVREEDSRTVQAYQWLRSVRQGVAFGTKGMSREVPGVLVKVSKAEEDHMGRKLPHGMTLHLINGDAFKRILFWRLAEGAEEEPVTFHGSTDIEYLRQIASERLEKDKSGREQWKRVRANHFLDNRVSGAQGNVQNGNRIFHGIEVDTYGNPAAYHIREDALGGEVPGLLNSISILGNSVRLPSPPRYAPCPAH